ncbi:MAG: TetR/AcrR family transcriptional regulator [Bdellovibrionota bacterium]|nr:TetR/AcrR family transcriptional regulator [Bdellovibrionota bacterium]
MTKGERTKQLIIREALNLASIVGLESLSIGEISKKVKMSRSGLFAHFNSKEQLQLDLLKTAEKHFIEIVLKPAESFDSPLEKLSSIQKHWPSWFDKAPFEMKGGCIFILAMIEFDDQPGLVRDFLYDQQNRLVKYIRKLARDAIRAGELKEQLDPELFAYEVYSLYLGQSIYRKFHGDSGAKAKFNQSVNDLIERWKA